MSTLNIQLSVYSSFKSRNENISIHHECPCRIRRSHPRVQPGTRLADSLVKNPNPWVRFPYPAWTGSRWLLFLSPLSELFQGPAWSCEIEVSHMGK